MSEGYQNEDGESEDPELQKQIEDQLAMMPIEKLDVRKATSQLKVDTTSQEGQEGTPKIVSESQEPETTDDRKVDDVENQMLVNDDDGSDESPE